MQRNLSHALDPKENIPWQSGPQERGGFTIVWSCLAVIFTCTWTTLHLTIPMAIDNDTWFKSVLRKVKWMMIMIICPEYVFAHAVLELKMALDSYLLMEESAEALKQTGWNIEVKKGARFVHSLLHGSKWPTMRRTNPNIMSPKVADTSTDPGQILAIKDRILPPDPRFESLPRERMWTLTHCYFANMGGFRINLVGHIFPGDNWELRRLSQWVTAMDLVNTLESMPRTDNSNPMEHIHISKNDILDKSKADNFIRVLWIWEILRLLVEVSVRAVCHYPIAQLEIITLSFAFISLAAIIVQSQKPKDVSQPMYLPDARVRFPETLQSSYQQGSLSTKIFGPIVPRAWDEDETTHVANDYFYDTPSNRKLFIIIFSFSTISFGLIHCGAWNFNFPTLVERWLWRGATVASISMPLLMLMVNRLMSRRLTRLEENWVESEADDAERARTGIDHRRDDVISWENVMVWAQVPGLVVYFLTRLAIIGISISCLRSAPRGMYWGIWSNFLPAIR